MNNQVLKVDASVFNIDVDKVKPNPYQPRKEFNDEALSALADSIKQFGVLQPIVVTRIEETKGDGSIETYYELIAGERRTKASKIAGLSKVPAIIKERNFSDSEKFELAIIENLQREDLNPVDRARAFSRLAEEFSMKHGDIAKKMGKSREYISNSLRMLLLPEFVLEGLIAGKISEGHTKPLLTLKDRPYEQEELFNRILKSKLTVRASVRVAKNILEENVGVKKEGPDPEMKIIEDKFSEKLGTKVHIDKNGDGGRLTIEFFSKSDLDNILNLVDESSGIEVADESKTLFSEEISKIDDFSVKKDNVEFGDSKDISLPKNDDDKINFKKTELAMEETKESDRGVDEIAKEPSDVDMGGFNIDFTTKPEKEVAAVSDTVTGEVDDKKEIDKKSEMKEVLDNGIHNFELNKEVYDFKASAEKAAEAASDKVLPDDKEKEIVSPIKKEEVVSNKVENPVSKGGFGDSDDKLKAFENINNVSREGEGSLKEKLSEIAVGKKAAVDFSADVTLNESDVNTDDISMEGNSLYEQFLKSKETVLSENVSVKDDNLNGEQAFSGETGEFMRAHNATFSKVGDGDSFVPKNEREIMRERLNIDGTNEPVAVVSTISEGSDFIPQPEELKTETKKNQEEDDAPDYIKNFSL